MYWFAALRQTSTVKISTFPLRFQIKELFLRVNKGKITGQNTLDENYFEIEGSPGSSKDEKALF